MKVAVLGTGRMGGAIARRLAGLGFDLVLWNRTRAKAESLQVGQVVATPSRAAEQASVIISSLAGPEALASVYEGAEGALQTARGAVFIETSTIGDAAVQALARRVAASASALLDAPILGTPATVGEGAAMILVAGDPAAIARVRAALEALGEVREVGAIGTASQLKLISNCMVAVQNVLTAELLAQARRWDLDTTVAFEVLLRQAPGLATRREHYKGSQPSPVVSPWRACSRTWTSPWRMHIGASCR